MPSVSIVVAYHASGPHPVDVPGYRAICNVTSDRSRPAGFAHDDLVHGRPDVNQAFCELSAFQAGLAMSNDDWLGLTHYRRLFSVDPQVGVSDRYPAFRRPSTFDWARVAEFGARSDRLVELASRSGFVTAPGLDVRRLGYSNLLEQYVDAHPIEQIDRADQMIARLVPNATGFRRYLSSARVFRPFNMILARREHVDAYASMLWAVLDDAWDALPHPTGPYERRWPGFLAERVLNYWLDVVVAERIIPGTLPLMLLHDATITNSSAPEQGVVEGGRPRGPRSVAAAALAHLAAPVVEPLARFERARAKQQAA